MPNDDYPKDTTPSQTAVQVAAQETLIVKLRNGHALEKQVIAVLEPQLALLDE